MFKSVCFLFASAKLRLYFELAKCFEKKIVGWGWRVVGARVKVVV
jgi:hypothetical protein